MVENARTSGWWPNLYDPLRNFGQRVADWFAPRSEASAMQDFYEINVELPGVKAEDVDVSVHDNNLMIRGEKKSERQESGRTFFFSELEYGAFQRSFRLPGDADSDKIDAAFKDGVLNLRIAKADTTKSAGKKISVRQS
jgi:HSP20 family protein